MKPSVTDPVSVRCDGVTGDGYRCGSTFRPDDLGHNCMAPLGWLHFSYWAEGEGAIYIVGNLCPLHIPPIWWRVRS